ncbi:MAG: HEPN domain-containing protein [Nitrospinae bacterium]|nr:HEPN domain-containing protein [Nitrospinota bacterium]
MDKLKPASEWFNQADYDLKTAEAMLKAGRYIYTVFMCHLCIEKALKGLYIQKLSNVPPKIHNLIYLLGKTGLIPPDNLKDFVAQLNQVSVPTRYPDELKVMIKEYNKQKANSILKNTKGLLKWLKGKLEKQ